MPDFDTVLASVREQLAVVERRRGEIERQREDVERQHGRLAAALSVLEEHAGPAVDANLSSEVSDPAPLTERVLEALVDSSAGTRAELVRLFRPLGIPENSVDSALSRLTKRGLIQRRGRRIIPVAQDPPSTAPAALAVPSGGSDVDRPTGGPEPAALDTAAVSPPSDLSAGTLPVPLPVPDDDALDPTSMRARVRDAVATSAATTRAALVKHFAAQGVGAASVDTALSGLRRLGVLERRSSGTHVVRAASGAESASADASSRAS